MRFTFMIHDRKDYRGGPTVNMRRLLPRLVERGHHVRVLGLAGDEAPTLDWLSREFGIAVCRVPESCRYTQQKVRWIISELSQNRPDLFVPNCFVAGFFAGRWARAAGIPTIGYMRSDDEFYWGLGREFVFGDTVWRLSGVACVSETLMRRVSDRLGGNADVKLRFLPSAVPLPDRPADQMRPGLRVCYIGRFEQRQKRIRETVSALFRNLRKGTVTHVGFFGDGREDGWLREQIGSFELRDRVSLHGSVLPESLHAAIGEYHASVLLSDYEGTPGAVMDAMATGLVPVTTKLPDGTSELVEDGVTGLQCDDREASFDRCMLRLSRDRELRIRLARNARARIQDRYALDSMVHGFESFSEEVFANRGRQRPLRVPLRLGLPPVRAGLSREDFRIKGRLELAANVSRRVLIHAAARLRLIGRVSKSFAGSSGKEDSCPSD